MDDGSPVFRGGTPISLKCLFSILILVLLPFASPSRGECREASVSPVPALSGQWITALGAGAGGLWVGTAGGRVAFLPGAGGGGRTYGPADGLPPGKINSVAVLDGAVYAGSEGGLAVLDGNAWKVIPSAEGKTLKNVFLRAEPEGKGLWACAVDLSGGLLRLDGNRWRFLGGGGKGLMNHIRAFAFAGDTAWLGSISSGVFSRKGDELRAYKKRDGLPSGSAFALEPFGGTVWAGTSAGPARFADGRWSAYPKSATLPLSAVFCLAAGPEALYLGGPEGLVRQRGGRFEPFPSGDLALRVGRVNALLFHEGALYVGAAEGLLRIEGW